jgi:hypothetical protein
MRHMHNMAKVMLATGLIVGYGYIMEAFFGWYSGNKYERYMIWNRMHGPYTLYYWALILCNIITPQFLWFKKMRSNLLVLWMISIRRQHRHVAGAVCDRGDQFASRLSAIVVGHVSADAVGLDHVYRHDRILLYAVVSVHSLPADDFDFRDAHDSAGSGGGGIVGNREDEQKTNRTKSYLTGATDSAWWTTRQRTHMRHAPPLYGVMAEFDNPSDLVRRRVERYEARLSAHQRLFAVSD